jgi:hypothetical protein
LFLNWIKKVCSEQKIPLADNKKISFCKKNHFFIGNLLKVALYYLNRRDCQMFGGQGRLANFWQSRLTGLTNCVM